MQRFATPACSFLPLPTFQRDYPGSKAKINHSICYKDKLTRLSSFVRLLMTSRESFKAITRPVNSLDHSRLGSHSPRAIKNNLSHLFKASDDIATTILTDSKLFWYWTNRPYSPCKPLHVSFGAYDSDSLARKSQLTQPGSALSDLWPLAVSGFFLLSGSRCWFRMVSIM